MNSGVEALSDIADTLAVESSEQSPCRCSEEEFICVAAGGKCVATAVSRGGRDFCLGGRTVRHGASSAHDGTVSALRAAATPLPSRLTDQL